MVDAEEVRLRTREYYDAVAGVYLERFRDELREKAYDRALLDRFAAALGPGARICDAGCGPCGHVTRHLAQSGSRVIGIDLSARCAALARAENPGLPFLVMSMEALGFREGCFDGVLAYHSILYTPKAALPGLLREFHRVLRPGGQLLVAVKEGEAEGFIPDPLGAGPPTFFSSFQQGELQGFLEEAGLRGVYAHTREPYEFELPVRRIYVVGQKPAP
jgi:SAM-dependent methyltransferase